MVSSSLHWTPQPDPSTTVPGVACTTRGLLTMWAGDELPDDVTRVLGHVHATIGEREEWARWPGGWPDDIESALVDAVFSARAVYRSERGRGTYASVVAWQQTRNRRVYSLGALLAEIDAAGVSGWADSFGNHQIAPRRPATAPLGRSKAAAVREAAWMLRQEAINIAGHITAGNTATAKRVLQSVPGIGYATASYFLMLLGAPGIKPDRMIHRFLQDAIGRPSTNARAEQLLQATAETLGAEAHELDHAIWSYQSTRAQHRR